jgi:hypothetical protein
MGLNHSREIEILNYKLEKAMSRIEILENSTTVIEKSVTNISDRQYIVDEHLNSLSSKIFNIQLLQEGRSVYTNKHQAHTRSFMK